MAKATNTSITSRNDTPDAVAIRAMVGKTRSLPALLKSALDRQAEPELDKLHSRYMAAEKAISAIHTATLAGLLAKADYLNIHNDPENPGIAESIIDDLREMAKATSALPV